MSWAKTVAEVLAGQWVLGNDAEYRRIVGYVTSFEEYLLLSDNKGIGSGPNFRFTVTMLPTERVLAYSRSEVTFSVGQLELIAKALRSADPRLRIRTTEELVADIRIAFSSDDRLPYIVIGQGRDLQWYAGIMRRDRDLVAQGNGVTLDAAIVNLIEVWTRVKQYISSSLSVSDYLRFAGTFTLPNEAAAAPEPVGRFANLEIDHGDK